MNRFQRLSCGFALFAGLVSTSPAAAEGFIDLAVGGAFTGEPFENSVTGGPRGGYWFEGIPFVDLGLALQLTVFSPLNVAAGGVNLRIISVPLTPMVMLRVPLLKSDRFEHGLLQPYVGAGPALTITSFDVSGGGALGVDADFSVGVEVDTGLNVHVLPWLSLFAEYRYNSVEPSIGIPIAGLPSVGFPLDTHSILGGVGFHF